MKSIKLTSDRTLDKNKAGYTLWGHFLLDDGVGFPIIITDAPYERLCMDEEYCNLFKQNLLEYKNETNADQIDEVIADITKHVEESV